MNYIMKYIQTAKLYDETYNLIVNENTFAELDPYLDALVKNQYDVISLTTSAKRSDIRKILLDYIEKRGFKYKKYYIDTNIPICKYHMYVGDRTYSYDDFICLYSDETCNYNYINVLAKREYFAIFLHDKYLNYNVEDLCRMIDSNIIEIGSHL